MSIACQIITSAIAFVTASLLTECCCCPVAGPMVSLLSKCGAIGEEEV
jgi:hypothetical protein